MTGDDKRLTFEVTLRNAPDVGSWTVFDVPDSVAWSGTGRTVKVVGEIDDVPVAITLMPTGRGGHMGPVKAATRARLGKQVGDDVRVSIEAVS